MSHFKAKMHQIRFRLELRPKTRWGGNRSGMKERQGKDGWGKKGREGRRKGERKEEGEGRGTREGKNAPFLRS